MRRSKKNNYREVRDPQTITSHRLSPPIIDLRTLEDRREYHPEGDNRPAKSFTRIAAHVVQKQPKKKNQKISATKKLHQVQTLSFNVPQSVAICIRRKTRTEVLHALRKTGRGISRRRPRRNQHSHISCRR